MAQPEKGRPAGKEKHAKHLDQLKQLDPTVIKLPNNINALRRGFPGLAEAWQTYHFDKKHSDKVKGYVEQHIPNKDKANAKQMENLHEKLIGPGKNIRSFEQAVLATTTAYRLERLRQEIRRKKEGGKAGYHESNTSEREQLWHVNNRTIRRTLQTMDQYVVLRDRFAKRNYGFQPNAQLEADAQRHLRTLTAAMQTGIDMTKKFVAGRPASNDERSRNFTKLCDSAAKAARATNTLYLDTVSRGMRLTFDLEVVRDKKKRIAGWANLPNERSELGLRQLAYLQYSGKENLKDIKYLLFPEAKRKDNGTPSGKEGDGDPIANLKHVELRGTINSRLDGMRNEFQGYFDDVEGKGNGKNKPSGLLDITKEIKTEHMYTKQGRMRLLKLMSAVLWYRGAIDYGIKKLRTLFLSSPETAKEYRDRKMKKLREGLGIPPDLDWNDNKAWKEFLDSPRSAKFKQKMTSIQDHINTHKGDVQKTIQDCRQDWKVFDALRTRCRGQILTGIKPDPEWRKKTTITLADIGQIRFRPNQQLSDGDKAKLLAALVVWSERAQHNWNTHNRSIGKLALDILDNVDTHADLAGRTPDVDDDEFPWWKLALAVAGYSFVRGQIAQPEKALFTPIARGLKLTVNNDIPGVVGYGWGKIKRIPTAFRIMNRYDNANIYYKKVQLLTDKAMKTPPGPQKVAIQAQADAAKKSLKEWVNLLEDISPRRAGAFYAKSAKADFKRMTSLLNKVSTMQSGPPRTILMEKVVEFGKGFRDNMSHLEKADPRRAAALHRSLTQEVLSSSDMPALTGKAGKLRYSIIYAAHKHGDAPAVGQKTNAPDVKAKSSMLQMRSNRTLDIDLKKVLGGGKNVTPDDIDILYYSQDFRDELTRLNLKKGDVKQIKDAIATGQFKAVKLSGRDLVLLDSDVRAALKVIDDVDLSDAQTVYKALEKAKVSQGTAEKLLRSGLCGRSKVVGSSLAKLSKGARMARGALRLGKGFVRSGAPLQLLFMGLEYANMKQAQAEAKEMKKQVEGKLDALVAKHEKFKKFGNGEYGYVNKDGKPVCKFSVSQFKLGEKADAARNRLEADGLIFAGQAAITGGAYLAGGTAAAGAASLVLLPVVIVGGIYANAKIEGEELKEYYAFLSDKDTPKLLIKVLGTKGLTLQSEYDLLTDSLGDAFSDKEWFAKSRNLREICAYSMWAGVLRKQAPGLYNLLLSNNTLEQDETFFNDTFMNLIAPRIANYLILNAKHNGLDWSQIRRLDITQMYYCVEQDELIRACKAVNEEVMGSYFVEKKILTYNDIITKTKVPKKPAEAKLAAEKKIADAKLQMFALGFSTIGGKRVSELIPDILKNGKPRVELITKRMNRILDEDAGKGYLFKKDWWKKVGDKNKRLITRNRLKMHLPSSVKTFNDVDVLSASWLTFDVPTKGIAGLDTDTLDARRAFAGKRFETEYISIPRPEHVYPGIEKLLNYPISTDTLHYPYEIIETLGKQYDELMQILDRTNGNPGRDMRFYLLKLQEFDRTVKQLEAELQKRASYTELAYENGVQWSKELVDIEDKARQDKTFALQNAYWKQDKTKPLTPYEKTRVEKETRKEMGRYHMQPVDWKAWDIEPYNDNLPQVATADLNPANNYDAMVLHGLTDVLRYSTEQWDSILIRKCNTAPKGKTLYLVTYIPKDWKAAKPVFVQAVAIGEVEKVTTEGIQKETAMEWGPRQMKLPGYITPKMRKELTKKQQIRIKDEAEMLKRDLVSVKQYQEEIQIVQGKQEGPELLKKNPLLYAMEQADKEPGRLIPTTIKTKNGPKQVFLVRSVTPENRAAARKPDGKLDRSKLGGQLVVLATDDNLTFYKKVLLDFDDPATGKALKLSGLSLSAQDFNALDRLRKAEKRKTVDKNGTVVLPPLPASTDGKIRNRTDVVKSIKDDWDKGWTKADYTYDTQTEGGVGILNVTTFRVDATDWQVKRYIGEVAWNKDVFPDGLTKDMFTKKVVDLLDRLNPKQRQVFLQTMRNYIEGKPHPDPAIQRLLQGKIQAVNATAVLEKLTDIRNNISASGKYLGGYRSNAAGTRQ